MGLLLAELVTAVGAQLTPPNTVCGADNIQLFYRPMKDWPFECERRLVLFENYLKELGCASGQTISDKCMTTVKVCGDNIVAMVVNETSLMSGIRNYIFMLLQIKSEDDVVAYDSHEGASSCPQICPVDR
ncbi:hypothetical protein GNI_148060 [Gregarina niphandrodes]|uniref:Uncharacterized protein n=1 Tax=Gregarina niphandrodes TaxID=110365 RepID=A0A023B063_GRENI|nr:hypothetical protein GNI_148060 [Gregarina niphandrodes]EZG44363.1 hypothetical protein GNI_148060 [Gregarina niphandrodes]|eukprot:XP_011132678.1 hypothetical protein GNI_148060 [Gregarina niphandrodes]